MTTARIDQAKIQTAKKTPHLRTLAIKEATRGELVSIGILLLLYLIMTVTFPVSWTRHDAGLQMRVTSVGTFAMYVICVWHSLRVKGTRQTVAFFGLSWVITFIAEFLGANYGFIFGSYDYTGAIGPRVGGVPVLIPINWGILQYSAFMLIDWLLGLGGERRGTTWYGKVLWSALIALSTGVTLTAADLVTDPAYVSDVWMKALGSEPWWWWEGGAYLPNLLVWQGEGGIPIQNFIGWTEVTFITVFIFYLFFQQKDRVTNRLFNIVPFLIYAYMYYALALMLLEMGWYDPGLQQPLLIGAYTMGPIILLGVIKLCKDYWRPVEPMDSAEKQ